MPLSLAFPSSILEWYVCLLSNNQDGVYSRSIKYAKSIKLAFPLPQQDAKLRRSYLVKSSRPSLCLCPRARAHHRLSSSLWTPSLSSNNSSLLAEPILMKKNRTSTTAATAVPNQKATL